MTQPFYERTGQLISPGDLFENMPYVRIPRPLRVFRKVKFTLSGKYIVQGELGEALDVEKDDPTPPFHFDSDGDGEHVLASTRIARAVFLTWGSEVEADERSGKLQRKTWLVAPVFPLSGINAEMVDPRTGQKFSLRTAIKEGKSPKFFPMPPTSADGSDDSYVDFSKISPLAANHFQGASRTWRLAPMALNGFYSQLMWFFTRKKLFFGPIECSNCGQPVDLGISFEGQPINPPEGP